jgi:hypothetical protein
MRWSFLAIVRLVTSDDCRYDVQGTPLKCEMDCHVWAVSAGHTRIATMLLDRGANTQQQHSSGQTAL